MKTPTFVRWSAIALLLVGGVTAARLAADETSSALRAQPKITHPLLQALVGTWNTKMSGKMTGTGRAVFTLGVGDTALIQDEQGEHKAAGGDAMQGFGHGVYRVGPDGTSLTAWWIDNHEPRMVETSGTIHETGFEIAGETSHGKFRIALERTEKGFEVKSFMADETAPVWTQIYERAPVAR